MYNAEAFHGPTKVSNVFIMLRQRATVFPQCFRVRVTSAMTQNVLKACLVGRAQTASGSQPHGNGNQACLLIHSGASGKR